MLLLSVLAFTASMTICLGDDEFRHIFNLQLPQVNEACETMNMDRGKCVHISRCPEMNGAPRYRFDTCDSRGGYVFCCPDYDSTEVWARPKPQKPSQPFEIKPPPPWITTSNYSGVTPGLWGWDRTTVRPPRSRKPTRRPFFKPSTTPKPNKGHDSSKEWGRPQPPKHQKQQPPWLRPTSPWIPWKPPTTPRNTSKPWSPPPKAPLFRPPTKPSPSRPPSVKPLIVPEKPILGSLSSTGGNNSLTVHRNRYLLPEEDCGIDVVQKIVGGNTALLEEFPWMALLRLKFSTGRTVYMCGGSLIHVRYVLTAAHCVRNKDFPPGAIIDQVRLGEFDLDKPIDCTSSGRCSPKPDDIVVEERIVHHGYKTNDPSSLHDIALLRLKWDAKISTYVQTICLPLDNLIDANYDGQKLNVAGWGKTSSENKGGSPVKLKVALPIIPFEECASSYRSKRIKLRSTQMCAGGEQGKDSCSGDSGGPLMSFDAIGSEYRWHVAGIVSFGPTRCGRPNEPAIYTRVGKYIDWILDNMRE